MATEDVFLVGAGVVAAAPSMPQDSRRPPLHKALCSARGAVGPATSVLAVTPSKAEVEDRPRSKRRTSFNFQVIAWPSATREETEATAAKDIFSANSNNKQQGQKTATHTTDTQTHGQGSEHNEEREGSSTKKQQKAGSDDQKTETKPQGYDFPEMFRQQSKKATTVQQSGKAKTVLGSDPKQSVQTKYGQGCDPKQGKTVLGGDPKQSVHAIRAAERAAAAASTMPHMRKEIQRTMV